VKHSEKTANLLSRGRHLRIGKVRKQVRPCSVHNLGRRGLGLCWLLLAFTSFGCTFCQDIRDGWKYRFTRPDNPLETLKSDNGNDRVWALRYLEEPLQHGGDEKKQELYLKILGGIACSYHDPLSRLQAIRTLGTYKDPRAVKYLEEAYWSAKAFPPEMATVLREQVLLSLGQTGRPEARELLLQVAKAGAQEETQAEKLQTLDLRLCALKGLGHFNQSDVVETLYQIMTSEKDVSLRDRAYASLKEATGERLPPDPVKWDKYLHGTPSERAAVVRESSWPFIDLVGWWWNF
jgi:hypothetical protein